MTLMLARVLFLCLISFTCGNYVKKEVTKLDEDLTKLEEDLTKLRNWEMHLGTVNLKGKEEMTKLEKNLTKLEEDLTKTRNWKMHGETTEVNLKGKERKVKKLEETVTNLIEKERKLNEKVMKLEETVKELEETATELEETATELKMSYATLKTGIESSFRTCQELRASDPSFPSGMRWIDPDGQGMGDDAIYVYCDMTSGSTSILHDSESPIDVGHCKDPGCYTRPINYNASIKQIQFLIELSEECHQSIKYECIHAPLISLTSAQCWWNDKYGNAKYFWSGNNTDGNHTCQCGIDGNCYDSDLNCNCDKNTQDPLVDDGVITDKNILPVTRLNFGLTESESSSGIHTLGRFECSGRDTVTGYPTSCNDLWLIGHTLNGFYSVKGAKMIETLFCDFSQLHDDAGFQKWIGYTDVKSAHVHFYVQHLTRFNSTGMPIHPFDLAIINEGNAMNLTTGIFMAPRTGLYFFSFTAHPLQYTRLDPSFYTFAIGIVLNGRIIGTTSDLKKGISDERKAVGSALTLQSTLNLKSGDHVWIQIVLIEPVAVLAKHEDRYTHFTGFLLEEEVVATL